MKPAGPDSPVTPGALDVGAPLLRREDFRLLTGTGAYIDDRNPPDHARAVIVRSPHAHAIVDALDCEAARTMPGVIGVFTADDLDRDGIGGLPWLVPPAVGEAGGVDAPEYPVLCRDRVRYVGDAVALVVAESLSQALDAAESVEVEYSILESVIRPEKALENGSRCFFLDTGDARAVESAMRSAANVVDIRVVNNRVVPTPLEPRGAMGVYDAASGAFHLYTNSQTPHLTRDCLATDVLGISSASLRVTVEDVGGAFGAKAPIYREQALVLWAARKTGRAVKWTADRSESFLCDTHGRDMITDAAMALDEHGRFLAMRVAVTANLGAYLSYYGAIPSATGIFALAGIYDIPCMHVSVNAVFTNTVMTDAYRGAGRPESVYALERLVDKAARRLELGVDEIRRRNLIASSRLPHRTALGATYDSGDFGRVLARALRASDWCGFSRRRAEAGARGVLRGIGLATYVERAAGGLDDAATVRLGADGQVTALLGTMSTGQGHETAYAQILCKVLGVPLDRVTVIQGDTQTVPSGRGTFGSRSLPVGGSALLLAAEEVLEEASRIGAEMLEVNAADLEFRDGVFRIKGTDRGIGLEEISRRASESAGADAGLSAEAAFAPAEPTFPNGCHVCEVEVDPETGVVTLRRYTAVDDFGRIINPLLVDGQVHGGIAQGIGQSLMERADYDLESGQLQSGSLMDYALPRADDLPQFALAREEYPCRNNPLGVKGCGEAGAIAAPPAFVNAVLDALREYGIEDIDMPLTPHVVWSAIRRSRQGRP